MNFLSFLSLVVLFCAVSAQEDAVDAVQEDDSNSGWTLSGVSILKAVNQSLTSGFDFFTGGGEDSGEGGVTDAPPTPPLDTPADSNPQEAEADVTDFDDDALTLSPEENVSVTTAPLVEVAESQLTGENSLSTEEESTEPTTALDSTSMEVPMSEVTSVPDGAVNTSESTADVSDEDDISSTAENVPTTEEEEEEEEEETMVTTAEEEITKEETDDDSSTHNNVDDVTHTEVDDQDNNEDDGEQVDDYHDEDGDEEDYKDVDNEEDEDEEDEDEDEFGDTEKNKATNSIPLAPILASVLGLLAVAIIALLAFYWRNKRRQRNQHHLRQDGRGSTIPDVKIVSMS